YNPFCHKTRHKTTKDQLQVLELSYVNNRKPDAKEREMLARRIDMTPRGVQIWFQNRRAKEKSIALK
ncbi:homeobox domain-containing protein, partial [Powellomyces hirtus]